jgi:hypothetical protein
MTIRSTTGFTPPESMPSIVGTMTSAAEVSAATDATATATTPVRRVQARTPRTMAIPEKKVTTSF